MSVTHDNVVARSGAFFTRGFGAGPNEVKVNLSDGGEQTISTKNIMIATGSDASSVPGLVIDEKKYDSCPMFAVKRIVMAPFSHPCTFSWAYDAIKAS